MTEQEWREAFIKKLNGLMVERNISQKELARAIDISDASAYRYVSGLRTPNGYVVSKICEYFNLPLDYFSTDLED